MLKNAPDFSTGCSTAFILGIPPVLKSNFWSHYTKGKKAAKLAQRNRKLDLNTKMWMLDFFFLMTSEKGERMSGFATKSCRVLTTNG